MRKMKFVALILSLLVVFASVGFAAGQPAEAKVIVRFARGESVQNAAMMLRGKGIHVRELPIINGIAFKGNIKAIEELGMEFDIVSVREDRQMHALKRGNNESDKTPPGWAEEGERPQQGTPGWAKEGEPTGDTGSDSQTILEASKVDSSVGSLAPPPWAGGGGKPPTPEGEEVDWGVEEIRAPEVWDAYTGSGVKVAVLDTGIDTGHSDLTVAGGASFVPLVPSYNDDNGHGTHVAGTIAALDNEIGYKGVAYEADLYAVKVLDASGSGDTSWVIAGIQWAVANNIDVINMSLGSDVPEPDLEAALDTAAIAGVIVVAASGNDTYDVDYPGAYANTIAVGAIRSNLRLARFSSQGPEVDVVAPGVKIWSTYAGDSYASSDGTSMACPHVAGLAALYKQKHPGADLGMFRAALQATSRDLGDPGFDEEYGYGLVDAYSMLILP